MRGKTVGSDMALNQEGIGLHERDSSEGGDV